MFQDGLGATVGCIKPDDHPGGGFGAFAVAVVGCGACGCEVAGTDVDGVGVGKYDGAEVNDCVTAAVACDGG